MASTRELLIESETGERSPVDRQPVVSAVVAVAALFMLVFGVWAFVWPESFAGFVQFPYHRHFLHDLGAFQIGIAAMLLFALWQRDAIAVVLAGFVVATALHAVSHLIDIDLGGRTTDWLVLALVALLAAAALAARRRFLAQREPAPLSSTTDRQPPKSGVRTSSQH